MPQDAADESVCVYWKVQEGVESQSADIGLEELTQPRPPIGIQVLADCVTHSRPEIAGPKPIDPLHHQEHGKGSAVAVQDASFRLGQPIPFQELAKQPGQPRAIFFGNGEFAKYLDLQRLWQ